MFNDISLSSVLAAVFFSTTLYSVIPELQSFSRSFSSFSPNYGDANIRSCNTSRFPPIAPSNQTPEQARTHHDIETLVDQIYGKNNFKLKNKEGAFIGPFAPLLYSPSVAPVFIRLANVTLATPLLSVREREMVALAVFSYDQPYYALYAHTRIAADAGFSPAQVLRARTGHTPRNLSVREETCFVLAKELARIRGHLSNEKYEKARVVLGRETAAAVIHLTGAFLYAGVLLNGADVCIPDGETLFVGDK